MNVDAKPLTVSQCIDLLNDALADVGVLAVQGEISDFRIAKDQLVYFTLKDARSRLLCFLLRWELSGPLENGMEVIVTGVPKIFQTGGGLHLRVSSIEPVGAGALRRAYELLKQKLEREGLFALTRKRLLPKYPEHIGVVTSAESAAWSDVQRVLQNRWPLAVVTLFHVSVQGAAAIRDIIGALHYVNTAPQLPDVLIVTRGGGSLEDLQAFNAEPVCRAIAASRVPVICGIGHERDITLAELTADERGSTPSNCAERATPDQHAISRILLDRSNSLVREMGRLIADRRVAVRGGVSSLLSYIGQVVARWQSLIPRFTLAIDRLMRERQTNLQQLAIRLRVLSPQATLKRGYTMTKQAGRIINRAVHVKSSTALTTVFFDGEVISRVE